jgi:hypothetical protein
MRIRATQFFSFFFLLAASIGSSCGGTVDGGGNGGSGNGGGSGGAGGTGGTGGTAPAFEACSGPGQCTLVNRECCAQCVEPDLSQRVAIHEDYVDEWSSQNCPMPTACPDCIPAAENPDLFAYCDSGKCVAANVTQHALSDCATSADCALRYGMSCCEGCAGGAEGLVAVSASAVGQIYELACDPLESCPACAPMYPPEYKAECVAGHCAVVGP